MGGSGRAVADHAGVGDEGVCWGRGGWCVENRDGVVEEQAGDDAQSRGRGGWCVLGLQGSNSMSFACTNLKY